MKNTTDPNKTLELEWHQLQLPYQSLRIRTESAKRRLLLSIHEHGLLTPVTVIPAKNAGSPWVVIDGYLRISALKDLGHDLVTATVWDIEAPDALLKAWQYNASRPWERLEEANLIQELITLYGFSQIQLAKRLGKSTTWICHRLQLLHDLPDFAQAAIHQGALSCWVASRILIPFARANSSHAKQFVDYLVSSNSHNSRDINAFYEHYLRSNRHVREDITANPSLFFKVRALTKLEATASCDKLAPEHVWESKIAQITTCLRTLQATLPAVFYPQQSQHEKQDLMASFNQLVSNFDLLQQALRRNMNVPNTHKTDCTTAPPGG
jgi:ParB family chromosome partitioning protein